MILPQRHDHGVFQPKIVFFQQGVGEGYAVVGFYILTYTVYLCRKNGNFCGFFHIDVYIFRTVIFILDFVFGYSVV